MDQFPLEDIVEQVGSRFAVVVAAAHRAQQIKDGSTPLVEIESRNPLTIALAEIAEGKVKVLAHSEPEDEVNTGTLDQYFAGREGAIDDGLTFRRAKRDDDEEDLDDLDDLDEDEDEDELDEDDEDAGE